MGFPFEKLKVWQKALELSDTVHIMSRNFPKEELFILTSQIKRAADSVSLNIAEGSTGQSKKEFNRFLGIALRSAIEVVACLYIAKKRTLISQQEFDEIYRYCEVLIKMIQALRKTLK